jgi:hypothetical protein
MTYRGSAPRGGGKTYFSLDCIYVYMFTRVSGDVDDVNRSYDGYEGYEDGWNYPLCYLS